MKDVGSKLKTHIVVACLSTRCFDMLVSVMQRMTNGTLHSTGASYNVKQTRFVDLGGIDQAVMEEKVFNIICDLEAGRIEFDDFSERLRKIQVKFTSSILLYQLHYSNESILIIIFHAMLKIIIIY